MSNNKEQIVSVQVKVEWLYAYPANGSPDNFKVSWNGANGIQHEVIVQNMVWENNVLRTHLLKREAGEEETDTMPVQYPCAIFGNVVLEFKMTHTVMFACVMSPA